MGEFWLSVSGADISGRKVIEPGVQGSWSCCIYRQEGEGEGWRRSASVSFHSLPVPRPWADIDHSHAGCDGGGQF